MIVWPSKPALTSHCVIELANLEARFELSSLRPSKWDATHDMRSILIFFQILWPFSMRFAGLWDQSCTQIDHECVSQKAWRAILTTSTSRLSLLWSTAPARQGLKIFRQKHTFYFFNWNFQIVKTRLGLCEIKQNASWQKLWTTFKNQILWVWLNKNQFHNFITWSCMHVKFWKKMSKLKMFRLRRGGEGLAGR